MATSKNLVNCVECGGQTYRKGAKCVHCGSPVNPKFGLFWITSPYTSVSSKALHWAGVVLVLFIVFVGMEPLLQDFAEDATIAFMGAVGNDEGQALAKEMYKK